MISTALPIGYSYSRIYNPIIRHSGTHEKLWSLEKFIEKRAEKMKKKASIGVTLYVVCIRVHPEMKWGRRRSAFLPSTTDVYISVPSTRRQTAGKHASCPRESKSESERENAPTTRQVRPLLKSLRATGIHGIARVMQRVYSLDKLPPELTRYHFHFHLHLHFLDTYQRGMTAK